MVLVKGLIVGKSFQSVSQTGIRVVEEVLTGMPVVVRSDSERSCRTVGSLESKLLVFHLVSEYRANCVRWVQTSDMVIDVP